VTGRDTWRRALVLVNANQRPVRLPLPPGDWQLFVDGCRAGLVPLRRIVEGADESDDWGMEVAGHSALVLAETLPTADPEFVEDGDA